MLSRSEFKALMDRWESTAWRWECQGVYREPSEEAPLARFRESGQVDLAWFAGWLARVRAWRAAGKRMGRVRMLTDPLTEYLRFELAITPPALDAGEDIRFLPAVRAADLGMPAEDFWLFDSTLVVVMAFGDHGVSGARVITETGMVARYREWRDRAVEASVALDELHLTT